MKTGKVDVLLGLQWGDEHECEHARHDHQEEIS